MNDRLEELLGLDDRDGPARRIDDAAMDRLVISALDEVMPERRRPWWVIAAAVALVFVASGASAALWYGLVEGPVGAPADGTVERPAEAGAAARADDEAAVESGSASTRVAGSELDDATDPESAVDPESDAPAEDGPAPAPDLDSDPKLDDRPTGIGRSDRARRRRRTPRRDSVERTLDPRPSTLDRAEGTSPDALLARANAARADRRYREAEQTYLAAIERAPSSDVAYVALVAAAGLRAERLGEPAGALTLYRRAARLRPTGSLDAEVLYGIADAHRRLGDDDEERTALDRLLARHPDSIYTGRARARREALNR